MRLPRRTTSTIRIGAAATAAAVALSLTGCIPPASTPSPAPSSPPPPAAVTPPPPPPPITMVPVMPLPDDWATQPRTEGDWVYRTLGGGSGAIFSDASGRALFSIACTPGTRRILLGRVAQGLPENPGMDIRTETAQRAVRLERAPDGNAAVWTLDANDSLLDAIAFSRGHFAVGVTGAQPIYPPAFPEITRVIEDCR